jgi:hypothetical protein
MQVAFTLYLESVAITVGPRAPERARSSLDIYVDSALSPRALGSRGPSDIDIR